MSETDVSQLVELALNQFGDAWHCDNVCYLWIHNNWSQTKGKPKKESWSRTKGWKKPIKELEEAVRNVWFLLLSPNVLVPRYREFDSGYARSLLVVVFHKFSFQNLSFKNSCVKVFVS